MEDQLLKLILADSFTQTKALRRLRILREAVLKKLFTSTEEKGALLEQFSGEDAAWFAALPKNLLDKFNDKNVYQSFNKIEDKIKSIKPLVMYLPIKLSEEAVIEIGKHLRSSYGEGFMMETKIDPSLIAGPRLIWNGLVKDYSLLRKIENNRQDIMATLKQFIKH